MDIQQVFYGVGIAFLLITIGYFVGTYLDDVPTNIKVMLAFLFSGILFLIGDILRRAGK